MVVVNADLIVEMEMVDAAVVDEVEKTLVVVETASAIVVVLSKLHPLLQAPLFCWAGSTS